MAQAGPGLHTDGLPIYNFSPSACLTTAFPVLFVLGLLFVSVSLSVLSMFIVKFSRFAPWGSPILGPWASALEVGVNTLVRSPEELPEAVLHME